MASVLSKPKESVSFRKYTDKPLFHVAWALLPEYLDGQECPSYGAIPCCKYDLIKADCYNFDHTAIRVTAR